MITELSKQLQSELEKKSDDYILGHLDALVDVLNLYDLDLPDRYSIQNTVEILSRIAVKRKLV